MNIHGVGKDPKTWSGLAPVPKRKLLYFSFKSWEKKAPPSSQWDNLLTGFPSDRLASVSPSSLSDLHLNLPPQPWGLLPAPKQATCIPSLSISSPSSTCTVHLSLLFKAHVYWRLRLHRFCEFISPSLAYHPSTPGKCQCWRLFLFTLFTTWLRLASCKPLMGRDKVPGQGQGTSCCAQKISWVFAFMILTLKHENMENTFPYPTCLQLRWTAKTLTQIDHENETQIPDLN